MSYEVLNTIHDEKRDKDNLREELAMDILVGFAGANKSLPSKYFYDDNGSLLFTEITKQKEYYLTNAEASIFKEHKSDILKNIKGEQFNLIELGAGDGQKTALLVEEIVKKNLDFKYIPIDISVGAIQTLTTLFEQKFPRIQINGIVGQYRDAIDHINRTTRGRNFVLFLGSSIGNFNRSQTLVFLRVLWRHLNNNDLVLIGFDLKKDISILNKAYNDKNKITEKFNLNLLTRINTELGANFNTSQFLHHGIYNPMLGAMESYLISKKRQRVYIQDLEKEYTFNEYEAIHLEYSHKYLQSDIEAFAFETGFKPVQTFKDDNEYFASSLWKVVKD